MRRPLLVALGALGTLLVSRTAEAACSEAHERVVRGSNLRCESVQSHFGALVLDQIVERSVATFPREKHESVRRMLDKSLQGGVIVTLDADVQIPIRREVWPDPRSPLEVLSDPQPMSQTISYWWQDTDDACRAHSSAARQTILVYKTCCDTRPSGDACLVELHYASPMPTEVEEKVARALAERAQDDTLPPE